LEEEALERVNAGDAYEIWSSDHNAIGKEDSLSGISTPSIDPRPSLQQVSTDVRPEHEHSWRSWEAKSAIRHNFTKGLHAFTNRQHTVSNPPPWSTLQCQKHKYFPQISIVSEIGDPGILESPGAGR